MDKALYKHSFKVQDKPLASLSVYNSGFQRCDAGCDWGPGVRDHYLLHYVTQGKGTYTAQGETYTLSEGDMFLAWPSDLIAYQADLEDPWTYCWVGFGGLDAGELILQTDFSQQQPILHVPDGEEPRELLMDIYRCRGARPYEVVRMTGKLYAFLAWLMKTSHADKKKRRQAGVEHAQRACDFIANNYADPITIADIAGSVGVCRSLLNRAFQQHMDISPMQYLTRYRMAQACRLLTRTDMAIKVVAFSVGYEDPLYFSRRFREVMGCSPRDYAQKQ